MSERVVKRYAFRLSQLSEVMGGRLEVVEYSGDGLPYVLATDYDAMHAEAEALRAENGRLRDEYDRDVYGLNNEGDPIGGDPAGGYANDNARLRAELEKARGLLREAREAYAKLRSLAEALEAAHERFAPAARIEALVEGHGPEGSLTGCRGRGCQDQGCPAHYAD